MTPWSCSIEHQEAGLVRLTLLHTTDAGPVREFTPFVEIDLDETHAIIMFVVHGLALQAISDARASGVVVPFPGTRS